MVLRCCGTNILVVNVVILTLEQVLGCCKPFRVSMLAMMFRKSALDAFPSLSIVTFLAIALMFIDAFGV